MTFILDLAAALPGRAFAMGAALGALLTLACLAGLYQFGVFPKETESMILSADYRLSRNESQLREEILYLQRELALSRRAGPAAMGDLGDSRS